MSDPASGEPPPAVMDRRAVRVRRLTSGTILIAGIGLSSLAGSAGGVLTAALTMLVWTIVIIGTLWLFRYARRSFAEDDTPRRR